MKNFTSKSLLKQVYLLSLIIGTFVPMEKLHAQTYCVPQSYYGAYYGYMQYQSFSTTGGLQNISFAPGGYPNPIPGSPSYPTTSNAAGEGYYPPSAFTTQCVTVQGATINYSFLTSSTYAGWLNIWVDYNQNGSFSDPGEWVFNPNATYPAGTTVNGSFTVPATASLGLTRIRVSWMYSAYSNPGPCYTYASNTMYYGVWTDFNFIVSGPCSGVPNALSIASPPMSGICSGGTAVVSATETNYSTGLVTKWQSSLSPSGPWTIVNGGVGGGQNVNTVNLTTPPLVDTTYFRIYDSCTNTFQTGSPSPVYMVPVIKYSIPYLETFNSTANNSVPTCYLFNDNNGTNFTVQSGLHAADGTAMTPAMFANDPATNAAYGKNDFFTLPGLKLTANTLYAIRFKYARGKSNPIANTGTAYNEHLQLFANNYNPQYVVSNVTSGNKLFDQTITVDNVLDTTLYFTPLATGGYYFSWYSNTAHPGGSTTTGGVVIVDSVYVGYGTCVAPALTSNPPGSQNGCAGLATSMSVTATGTGNNYQWYKNGNPIANAVNPTYNIASTQSSDAGTYYCIVSNPCGTQTSTSDVLTVYALPTASITPSATVTICSASGYALTANTSASNPSVTWYKNGVSVGTGTSYYPTSTGLYFAKITDANNCTATTSNTDTINVNQSPSAVVSPSGSTSFCVGDSVTLFAPVGGGITGYQWYDGATVLTGQVFSSFKALSSGNFKVLVSNANCQLMSSVTPVTVSTPPTATISVPGSTTICQGSNIVLSASTGTNYTYTWRLNGTPTAINSQNDTVTQAGNYSVTVAIGTCASTSTDVTISLNPAPTPTLNPAGTVNLCTGSTVNLVASGAGVGGSYSWYYNGAQNGNSLNVQSANTSGEYKVLVTNSQGCSAMSTPANVNIIAPPPATVTPSATAICAGNTVTLNANLGAGYTYQWLKNGNAVGGATGAAFSDNPGANTPYSIIVTDANGCKDTSAATTISVNALPTPTTSTSGSTSFCPGGSVTITANNPGSFQYKWYNNGNLIAGATAASYVANAAGSYAVYELDGNGCFATSASRTVTVNANPTAVISTNGPTTFCPGGNVILTATTTPSTGFTYVWLNGSTAVGNAANYTANTSGSFRVKVTSTTTGCFDTTSAVAVSLFSSPNNIIAPAGPTTFCQGASVVLNTSVVSGVNYQWQLNGVNISGADSSTYTANQNGSYTVVVSNSNCSSTTPAVSITVNPLPTATITPSGALTFCSNNSVTLSANSGAGLTYQWLVNGANINGAGASAQNYTTSSTGIYKVVVTDANGCSTLSTDSEDVHVFVASTSTITTPGSPVVCQGDTVHLYSNVTNPSNITSYQWLNNGNVIAGAINPSYNATTSGVYTLVLKSNSVNACYDTSAAKNVIVNPKPVPVINAAANVLSTTTTYVNYQWYLNGVAISGAHYQSYTATQTGNYTVFVVDNNGCSAISAAFNVTDLAVNGINATGAAVNIYPNPAVNVIHVDATVDVNIAISTIDGKQVIVNNNAKDVDITALPQGIYIIKVYNTNGNLLKVEKIVKNNF